jgi:hypothetical protein
VRAFLIGCAVLLMAGASGVRAEASQQNKQTHTEASKKEQGSSSQATASDEARCEGTRTYRRKAGDMLVYTTNDLPGCPKGGLLLGTDKADKFPRPGLDGLDGDDKIRGLGGSDDIFHGSGDDVIYAGPGNDTVFPDEGKDVIYGGDGNDMLASIDVDGRDKLYCGAGRDRYFAENNDYVDSSCETASASAAPDDRGHDVASVASSASASPVPIPQSGGPAILLPAAALLLGSGILTYAILRRR